MNRTEVFSRTASAPRAALARYAGAHRALLEVAIESHERYGDRNYLIRVPVITAHDAAYSAIPWWLRWAALPVELRVAREMNFRNRVSR